jgi:general secretion pathway protein G
MSNLINHSGFSLIEVMISIGILGIVSSMGFNAYENYVTTGRINNAVSQIRSIEFAIIDYVSANRKNPDNLAEVDADLVDPWGNPYQYYNVSGSTQGRGNARKDKNLTPINTDYDLYSMGPDGRSKAPLTAKDSHDDIVRANNGRYVGLAEGY